MKIVLMIGARPNYPKAKVVIRALRRLVETNKINSFEVVHSGQHYDAKMNSDLLEELGIKIDTQLVQPKECAESFRLSSLILSINRFFKNKDYDYAIVLGDVHTTVAAAIAAKLNGMIVIHVEAGLRSGSRDPEEYNRLLITDVSDYHLCPSIHSFSNLIAEGISRENIFIVGNTMAESCLEIVQQQALPKGDSKDFVLFSVHKAYNKERMEDIFSLLDELLKKERIIFPIHPSMKTLFDNFENPRLLKTEPLGYTTLINTILKARYVVTDSAGIQEECTVLRKRCYTIGDVTARPETLSEGSNLLIGYEASKIFLDKKRSSKFVVPKFWDNKVSERIEAVIERIIDETNKANIV